MRVLALTPPSKYSKNVARDLLFGCWCKGKRIAGTSFPPLTLLSVATVLKEAGHDVRLFDAAGERSSLDDIIKVIKEFDLVVVLTATMSFNEDSQILKGLKNENEDLTTIVFGSHPTFMTRETVINEGIDIAVRYEAEFVIRDLVSVLENNGNEWKKIRGIGYLDGDKPIINEDYPFADNLDDLPFPDRTMLPRDVEYFNPVIKKIPYTTMLTGRGCPGRCTFCSAPSFAGRKIRLRSSKSVLDEMELVQSQGYKEVFFRDEMFTVSKKRVIEICEGIRERKIDLSWICSSRIGTVDEEMMKEMKEAGCHMIRFGVESGVQELLDNIKKGIKVEQTGETFRLLHKVGLDSHAHMMLGIPGESQETIKKTIEFVKEIDPTIVTFAICTPYPGTRLFEEVQSKNPEIKDGSSCTLEDIHTTGYYNQFFTSLTGKELEDNIRKAYRGFYLRPFYLMKWIGRIRSLAELRRVSMAGVQVFDFILRGD